MHNVESALEVTYAGVIESASPARESHHMPIPLSSRQIANDLQDRIRAGEYAPGARLPALWELGQLYSVSISTIQRALDRLKERGLVEGSQGRGIYVVDELPKQ